MHACSYTRQYRLIETKFSHFHLDSNWTQDFGPSVATTLVLGAVLAPCRGCTLPLRQTPAAVRTLIQFVSWALSALSIVLDRPGSGYLLLPRVFLPSSSLLPACHKQWIPLLAQHTVYCRQQSCHGGELEPLLFDVETKQGESVGLTTG